MADEYILKHLQDILDAIEELEGLFENYPRRFDVFDCDKLRICAVERKTEIMGEAINRIKKYNPTFHIPNAREIINTRNRIIHGYDSVESEFLWGLVIRHIPLLQVDILRLISEMEDDPIDFAN